MGEAIEICELIKYERKKQGLSQPELGKLSGYATSSISMWERGERTPTLFQAECILKVLGYQLKAVKL